MITIKNKIAARTGVSALGKRFLLLVPTPTTILARVGGIDCHILTTSVCCFVRQAIGKSRPCRVLNGLSQTVVMYHSINGKILNRDYLKSVDYLPAFLVDKVMALIRYSLVNVRDALAVFGTLWRTFFVLCHATLFFGERLLFQTEEARVFNLLAIGKSGERCKPNVDANPFITFRKWFRFYFTSNCHEPLACGCPPHSAGFRHSLKWSVLLNFNTSDFRKGKTLTRQFAPTRPLWISDAIVPTLAFETGVARFFPSGLYAPKVRFERKVNTDSYILQNLRVHLWKVRAIFFPRGNVPLLFKARKRFAIYIISGFSLLKQSVIQVATRFQGLQKNCLLCPSWIHPILYATCLHGLNIP